MGNGRTSVKLLWTKWYIRLASLLKWHLIQSLDFKVGAGTKFPAEKSSAAGNPNNSWPNKTCKYEAAGSLDLSLHVRMAMSAPMRARPQDPHTDLINTLIIISLLKVRKCILMFIYLRHSIASSQKATACPDIDNWGNSYHSVVFLQPLSSRDVTVGDGAHLFYDAVTHWWWIIEACHRRIRALSIDGRLLCNLCCGNVISFIVLAQYSTNYNHFNPPHMKK